MTVNLQFISFLDIHQKLLMFAKLLKVRIMLKACAFISFWIFIKFLVLMEDKTDQELNIFSYL
jgi:hypothetical protein